MYDMYNPSISGIGSSREVKRQIRQTEWISNLLWMETAMWNWTVIINVIGGLEGGGGGRAFVYPLGCEIVRLPQQVVFLPHSTGVLLYCLLSSCSAHHLFTSVGVLRETAAPECQWVWIVLCDALASCPDYISTRLCFFGFGATVTLFPALYVKHH